MEQLLDLIAKFLINFYFCVFLVGFPQKLYSAGCSTPDHSVQIVLNDAPEDLHYNWFLSDADRLHGATQGLIEPLFARNPETGRLVGWLARRYRREDNSTFVIQLRRGAEWSDGTEFTSRDVVFSLLLPKGNPELDGLHVAELRDAVKSATTQGKRRVKISLNEPDPDFVEKYLTASDVDAFAIVPRHVWDGEDPEIFKNKNPIGTGAYTFRKDGDDWPSWMRNDDWWAKKSNTFKLPTPIVVEFRTTGRAEAEIRSLTRGCTDVLTGVSLGMASGAERIAPFLHKGKNADAGDADLLGSARWTGWALLPNITTEAVLSHHARWFIHRAEKPVLESN